MNRQTLGPLPRLHLEEMQPNRGYIHTRRQIQSTSATRKHERASSRGSNSSKEAVVKQPTESNQHQAKRNLIGPLVLNPYRHRRHNSSGMRVDSQTPERRLEQVASSIHNKREIVYRSKLLTQRHSTEKEQVKQPSSTFKHWLRSYIEELNMQKCKKEKEPEKRLNRRQLIDKISGRGLYRHRGTHQILDCQQLLGQERFFEDTEESCIFHTEEENPHELGSMNSLLRLIGK